MEEAIKFDVFKTSTNAYFYRGLSFAEPPSCSSVVFLSGFFVLANNLACEYEGMFQRKHSPSIDKAAATSNVLLVFQLNPEVEKNITEIFFKVSPRHYQ